MLGECCIWRAYHTFPLLRGTTHVFPLHKGKIYGETLSVLNQSQMDMQLWSLHAKQEAYWAELHRANESLREDLPAGLKPTLLGTERSVVSSKPPNEMHRVIWLTISILLQACEGVPDGTWKCHVDLQYLQYLMKRRLVLPPVSSWWGIFSVYDEKLRRQAVFSVVFVIFSKLELVNAALYSEDTPSTCSY